MTQAHTFRLESFRLLLAAERMRRYNHGRTCALAAYTRGPVLMVDCSRPGRLRMRQEAQRFGISRCEVSPLYRGHIADLIMRTRLAHGLAEVRKTWGTGLRALLAEDKWCLKGGER